MTVDEALNRLKHIKYLVDAIFNDKNSLKKHPSLIN